MHAERASTTALLVAALRALASTDPAGVVRDDQAAHFLPRSWALLLALATSRRRAGALARRLPDAVSPGRLQHIALRTRVIDDAVCAELARGGRQLVLLGAGFDTRAYRLQPLARAVVFEVDHPATQRQKRARGRILVPVAREQRFVALDFERDSLERALSASSFDSAAPSVVVWEGVTMYLTLGAIRATLAALSRSMAPGSLLILSYYDPSGASGPPSRSTSRLAELLGERFLTRWSPAEAGALVREFGFDLVGDSGRDDWVRAFHQTKRGRAEERVLLARRIAASA